MPAIDLVNVLGLLTQAKNLGIRISYHNAKIEIKYPKSKYIHADFLKELRSNKDQLIEYFKYYNEEFNATVEHNMVEQYGAAAGVHEPIRIANDHILLLNPNLSGVPIFIIPGVGGKCGGYKDLADEFIGICPVFGIEMMGTLKNEFPFGTMMEIIENNIKWIQTIQPKGPYQFIGHSFGAIVMYEMVKMLEQKGEHVNFIGVLDQEIKPLLGLTPEDSLEDYVLTIVGDYFESFKIISRPFPDWVDELRREIMNLPLESMLRFITAYTSKKIPQAARVIDYVSRLIAVRVSNEILTFFPNEKLITRVVIIKAADNQNKDATLNWEQYAKNVEVVTVNGDHHNMLHQGKVHEVALRLKCLVSES